MLLVSIFFIVFFRWLVLVLRLNEQCSVIVNDSIQVIGFVLFWLVILGVELCIGLQSVLGWLFVIGRLSDVDGSMFSELVSIVVVFDSRLLNRLLVMIMLNCLGQWYSCIVFVLVYMWFSLMLGYFLLCIF